MTEAEARAALELAVAWETHPVLTTEAVDALLVASQIADADGLLPTDEDWTPTWDPNAGAADGWMLKAGLVAGGYDFGEDGQNFSRSQVHAHCVAMAKHYRSRAGRSSFRSVTLVTPYSGPAVTTSSLLDFGDA
jgi:hypothetical protein